MINFKSMLGILWYLTYLLKIKHLMKMLETEQVTR